MCESIETSMLSFFTRIHFYLYAVVSSRNVLSFYEKKYDGKLPKLYQIRGRINDQYSSRAHRALIQEKRIFLSIVIRYSLLQRFTFLQTYQLLMK